MIKESRECGRRNQKRRKEETVRKEEKPVESREKSVKGDSK